MRLAIGRGEDGVALIRAASGDSIVAVIDPAIGPVEKAALIAAIGQLAIERAPDGRLNAVAPDIGADPAAIDAIAAFLDAAPSITGQLLVVSAA